MARQHEVSMLLLFIAAAVIGKCNGEVYRVGDVSGWTAMNIDADYYQNWASSKSFKVGDTLVFEYDNNFHNVIRVRHTNFNDCNATSPYGMRDSGNDSFSINRSGHFYFICGVPGHCEMGQRVDIWVSEGKAPEPSPSPSNSVQSTVGPSASEPVAPATKENGASTAEFSWKILAAVVAVLGWLLLD